MEIEDENDEKQHQWPKSHEVLRENDICNQNNSWYLTQKYNQGYKYGHLICLNIFSRANKQSINVKSINVGVSYLYLPLSKSQLSGSVILV